MPIGRQPDLRAVTGRPFASMSLSELVAERLVWTDIVNSNRYTDAVRRMAMRHAARCTDFVKAAVLLGEN